MGAEGWKLNVVVDQEVDVTVVSILEWGVTVITQDGEHGFIDNLKIPFESDDARFPEVGNPVKIVVLDDSRTPFRGSLLQDDFSLARESRQRDR
jgi:predicted RNA-binding protein (virulence factor B family)